METKDDFVTIQDAARYLGVSTQTLRRWDERGKLKAVRRPASDYRYYKLSDLEPFRLEYQRAQSQTAATSLTFSEPLESEY